MMMRCPLCCREVNAHHLLRLDWHSLHCAWQSAACSLHLSLCILCAWCCNGKTVGMSWVQLLSKFTAAHCLCQQADNVLLSGVHCTVMFTSFFSQATQHLCQGDEELFQESGTLPLFTLYWLYFLLTTLRSPMQTFIHFQQDYCNVLLDAVADYNHCWMLHAASTSHQLYAASTDLSTSARICPCMEMPLWQCCGSWM